ncbi:MAG: complex I subunit 4 family protein [Aggregatilineales bacterium]
MLLTAILVIPIAAALFILFALKPEQRSETRFVAAGATAACLVLAILVFIEMGRASAAPSAHAQTQTQYGLSTFIEEVNVPWIPALGISYHVGADGVTAPMLLLTGLASFCGVLISWRIEDRTREFMAFFLLLVAGVYGVFVSLDMFLLLFWYEFSIFPMYLLIATWGWVERREYAAMKLTLYILIGSVVALVGVLVMYFSAGRFFADTAHPERLTELRQALDNPSEPAYSFNFSHLEAASRWQQISALAATQNAKNSPTVAQATGEPGPFDTLGVFGATIAKFWFPFVFIGFGVLAGLFPFHNWSPDGHVAAPTAVSMIHAGVLMKLGAYAALRVGVQLLPEGAKVHLPWIILLALINVVYGAFIAFRQRDFKYVIGFSSVSHMGLVSMGFASMSLVGMTGAGLQMFSHGAMTALFFACVGMVYDQAHTRDIPSLSGFAQKMPLVAVAFALGGLVSMGMPGLSGFIAEFPIFTGIWQGPATGGINYYPIVAILAALGIILTAAYVLRVTFQVFGGQFNEQRFPGITAITRQDRAAILILAASLIVVGVFPQILAPIVQSGMMPILNALKGG